jgi:hypothetical protein
VSAECPCNLFGGRSRRHVEFRPQQTSPHDLGGGQ